MAQKELVEIVRKGRRAVARWRREHPDVLLDLVDADLSELKLPGVNLRRADLVGADLNKTDLSGANLAGADMTRAKLTEANLSRAAMVRTRLFRANLNGARLEGANLGEAMLEGADLGGAVLGRCDLTNANLREADLSGAELLFVNLSQADLELANFDRSRIGWTIWGNVDLSRASGLEATTHVGPSSIGVDTLERSGGRIPSAFLRGCGVGQQWIELDEGLEERVAASDPFFIVYSEDLETFAGRLHNTLQKHGLRCWLAPRRDGVEPPGATSAGRGIRAWDRILLCANRAALSSEWINDEIDSALKREEFIKQQAGRDSNVLWPLNLDGYMFSGNWEHTHEREIAGRVLADFTGWRRNKTKFLEELTRLVEALKDEVGGRSARRSS